MTTSVTEGNYLWRLLTTNQVESIQTTILIAADSRENTLPDEIFSEAIPLLQNLKGRIFPIALRGKSQTGKSTTLNRFPKVAKFSVEKKLPVGKSSGITTTQGIWLMIITFRNHDALLLFDMQGVDRGADEVTYKLIAFTDQICTKVVDVFRMPWEGFSNEYISTLYCLSNARDSVKDLEPASDKAILWTDCVLPKQSPYGEKTCNKPDEYHLEILRCVYGERVAQAEKAAQYSKQTPVFATQKPPDDIKSEISELDDDHPFIEKEIIPTLQNILFDVSSFKILSCEIKGAIDYVGYLNKIFKCIKQKQIDLPFCQSEIIQSMVSSNVNEQKRWISEQSQQIKQDKSTDWDWIENNSQHEIENIRNQCIQQFENAFSGFARTRWEDRLGDLTVYIEQCTRELIDQLKCSIIEIFVPKKYPELHHLCTLGYKSNELKNELNKKKNEIITQLRGTSIFTNKIDTEEKLVEQTLDIRIDELYRIQQSIENRWSSCETKFEKEIYDPDDNGIDQIIDDMIREHNEFAISEYAKFGVTPKILFDIATKKQELKEHNRNRVNQMIDVCQRKYISQFNSFIEQLLLKSITVQEKYKNLEEELKKCRIQYYSELKSPWNDRSADIMAEQFNKSYNRALDLIYTPGILDELKKQRIAQMEYTSKFMANDQESCVWFHCVYCERIFAGRINAGCDKTRCDYDDPGKEFTRNTEDYVCLNEFNWKKAKPVDFSKFPNEFWFSPIEIRGRKNILSNTLDYLKTRIRTPSGILGRVRQIFKSSNH